jgi:hypothetical protein
VTLATLPEIAPWPLAALLANNVTTGTWAVACTPIECLETVAEDLREQMESLFDTPVALVRVGAAPDVEKAIKSHPDTALVVLGLQSWKEPDWNQLDLLRSRLAREPPTLLVLDEASAAMFSSHAPNLWSWVGGAVWGVGNSAPDVE